MEREQSALTVVPYLGPDQPTRRGKRQRVSVADEHGSSSPQSPATRIKNACHQCRVKKTRCSGHKPCLRCIQRGMTCRYMPTMSPAHSTHATTNTTNGACSPSVATFSSEFLQNEHRPSCRSAASASQDMTLDIPYADPRGSDANDGNYNNDVDKGISGTPMQHDQYGHVHGGSSVFAFLNFAKQKLARLPAMSIDFCDYPLTSSGFPPRVFPPKEVADQMIKSYFEFGLNTSRFVHEPTFRETYERLYAVGSGGSLQPDSLVLTYMILALGSHYSRLDNMWCGYSASVQFYEMAEQQLSKASSRITLTSLQARLLVVHYLLNHSRMHEAWSSFGTVVRHAQALGLHCRSRKNPDNYVVHEYRKRVFWVIYINDRILSSIFGRPCAIHDDDVDQEECALSNDEDITPSACRPAPPNELCSAAALVHYVRLVRILGKILRQFYSLTTKPQTLSDLYSIAMEFEAALADWQSALPKYLDFAVLPSSALSIPLHRQLSTLKLTYAYANLLLYRPFVLHSIGSSTNSTHMDFEQWVKRCHDESIAAADMIVSECQALHRRGLFSRTFWMHNYAQFTAIGTLYMYYHLWPDADHVWKVAEEARTHFPVGVEGDLVGQRYIEILNELSRITSDRREQHSDNILLPDPADGQSLGEDALIVDVPTMDFGGPWSNFFLDPNMFVDYVGNQADW